MEAWRIWPRFRCAGSRQRESDSKESSPSLWRLGHEKGGSAAHNHQYPLRVLLMAEPESNASMKRDDASHRTETTVDAGVDLDVDLGLPPHPLARLESHGYHRLSIDGFGLNGSRPSSSRSPLGLA